MVMAHYPDVDAVVYQQEATVRRLLDGDEDVRAIPCMHCSLRFGNQQNNHPARLPKIAHNDTNDSVARGVKGNTFSKGRGRARALKERARRAQERKSKINSSPSNQDDSSSVVSSAYSFNLEDDYSEHGSGSVTVPLPSSTSSQKSSSPVPWSDLTISTSTKNTLPISSSEKVDSVETAASDSVSPFFELVSTRTVSPPSEQEEKQLNVESKQARSKKTKYVPLDMREAYEQHQAELLEGTPAGAENSCGSRGGFDKFALGSEHVPCFTPGYRDQRKPKVNSILDFPSLRTDTKLKGEINFMNVMPKKHQSMKAIASFITDKKETIEASEEPDTDDAGEDDETGPIVVVENVPARVTRRDLTDLIEPYGAVSKIIIEKTGLTKRAFVRMVDKTEAQWVVDILDNSDSLIDADESGPLLKVQLQEKNC